MNTIAWRSIILGLAVASIAVAASCASSGKAPTTTAGSLAADETRKTQQELQSALMAFADRYFAVALDAARALEQGEATPEDRYNAAGVRFLALMVATDIAASPSPAAAVLDMTVLVTLKRIVFEDYWLPEVFGKSGPPLLDAYLELEEDIWDIAAGVYTTEQLSDLRMLIDDWRAKHPDAVSVDFIRLAELGESRQVRTLIDTGRSGGMLAPVREANRNIEEMRMLSERLVFMATRMQMLLSIQMDMASAKLTNMPEIQQLLEDSQTFTEATDRAAEAFAALVADLPEERRAAVDQIMGGLSEERRAILADFAEEDGMLRPALGDLRLTLEAGREFAVVLEEAMRATDGLFARAIAGNEDAARPFDIFDYKATLAEATMTA